MSKYFHREKKNYFVRNIFLKTLRQERRKNENSARNKEKLFETVHNYIKKKKERKKKEVQLQRGVMGRKSYQKCETTLLRTAEIMYQRGLNAILLWFNLSTP